jgi:hypothetical protein
MDFSEDFNYVFCNEGICACKDGFSGNATDGNKCDCIAPNVVVYENNQTFCRIPQETLTPSVPECTESSQCIEVSEHYNYVICSEGGKCICKDGFSGNATTDSKCDCIAPNEVIYEMNEAFCRPTEIPDESDEPIPTESPECSAQWECMGVAEHINYVLCVEGQCICKVGFSGNATTESKCSCPAPNVLVYENGEASCNPPTETTAPETDAPIPPETISPPCLCSAQYECTSVTENYNFVLCSEEGKCICRDGFSGNATLTSKCNCLEPNTIAYENNLAVCKPPQLPETNEAQP